MKKHLHNTFHMVAICFESYCARPDLIGSIWGDTQKVTLRTLCLLLINKCCIVSVANHRHIYKLSTATYGRPKIYVLKKTCVGPWSWGNNNCPRKDVTSSCVRKIEVHVLVKL